MGDCPNIESCGAVITENTYKKDCKGDWKNCFIMLTKTPSEWKKIEETKTNDKGSN